MAPGEPSLLDSDKDGAPGSKCIGHMELHGHHSESGGGGIRRRTASCPWLVVVEETTW